MLEVIFYLKMKKIVSPSTLSIGKKAVVEVSDSNINNVQNEGTFINDRNSVVNTVAMSADSQVYSDINTNLKVQNAEINGTVTVTNNNGNYYVSVLTEFEKEIQKIPSSDKVIGLDFSMSELFVSPENQRADYPRYFRMLEKN